MQSSTTLNEVVEKFKTKREFLEDVVKWLKTDPSVFAKVTDDDKIEIID